MKSIVILFIQLIFINSLFSQLVENFDDGDFYFNPTWYGDTSFFVVNDSGELQSQGPSISSEIYLSLMYPMSQTSIWEFDARLDFATSTSNYARFYLSSDQPDFSDDLLGYYVKLGGESGSNDGIDLYIQNEGNHTKIIDGPDGFFGKDFNHARIRVQRSFLGEWKLWADTGTNNNFILQGSNYESQINLSQYTGVFCKHSSTRSDKFYFDNINIHDGDFDVMYCKALNDTTLEIVFSNPPDSNSSINPNNYIINKAIANPKLVTSHDSFPHSRFLHLASRLGAGDYIINALNITDRQNQLLIMDSASFHFYPFPSSSELIFNEIMYDPSPAVGMPEKEYIELMNSSNQTLNLNGIRYSDSNTEVLLPEILLDSGQYLILCDIEDTAEFKSFGKVFGLEPWPSLNNSGDILTLRSRENQIIDQLEYDEYWSSGNPKGEGGWSFEKINPFKLCTNNENWTYSINNNGGTPGQINSVFNSDPDISGPELVNLDVLSATYLKLNFNESLDLDQSMTGRLSFDSNNQIDAYLIGERSIELSLLKSLDSGFIYTLRIDTVFDCESNVSVNTDARFGLGKIPGLFDLIITEIMFDPEPQNSLPATEYIELYNNSDKIITLNSIKIISEDDTAELSENSIYPNEYVILCPSSKFDEMTEISRAIKLSPWTSLKNDQDEIAVFYKSDLIHKINYSSDWISNIEKKEGGWSLEMIDPKNPCGEIFNWNASENPNGGTPGKVNSISANNLDLSAASITKIEIINLNQIRVHFNEFIDLSNLHLNNIHIEPSNEIADLYFEERLSKSLDIYFSEILEFDQTYQLVLNQIKDCSQNYDDLIFQFVLPEHPQQNDIAINEILFNSFSGASEFIELYNMRSKNLNLKNTIIKYYNEDGTLKSELTLAKENYILEPFDYITICKDSVSIVNNYPRHGNLFCEISGFPSLNNNSGYLSLLDSNRYLIDSVYYSNELHFELIENEKGVSLERLSTEISGMKNDNWTSASESYGFGSPGILNSKSIERIADEEKVIIQPELFSPDGDGYKDLLRISFNINDPQSMASINIFDLNGRLIKSLANNFTLAYDNDFIWDGITDQGEKARIGNYIILIDLFSLNGKRNKIKKIVGLGGRI